MPTVSPRVVVADDSALMRRIVSNSLTRAGVDVVGAAADGDQALALCERERPDAMTLDLAMPGLDGLGVLRRLKARRRAPPGRRRISVLAVPRGPRRRRARGGRVRPRAQAGRRREPRRVHREPRHEGPTRRRCVVGSSDQRRARRSAPSGPADRTRTHGRHRHLHWRPPGARRSAPQASRSPRRGHA